MDMNLKTLNMSLNTTRKSIVLTNFNSVLLGDTNFDFAKSKLISKYSKNSMINTSYTNSYSILHTNKALITDLNSTQYIPLYLLSDNIYKNLHTFKNSQETSILRNFINLADDFRRGRGTLNFDDTIRRAHNFNGSAAPETQVVKYLSLIATIVKRKNPFESMTSVSLPTFLDVLIADSETLIAKFYSFPTPIDGIINTYNEVIKILLFEYHTQSVPRKAQFKGINYMMASGLIVDLTNNKVIAAVTLNTDFMQYYLDSKVLAGNPTHVEKVSECSSKIYKVFIDNDEITPETRTVSSTMWSIILNTFVESAANTETPLETLDGKKLFKQFYPEEISVAGSNNIMTQISENETIQDEYLEHKLSKEKESFLITP